MKEDLAQQIYDLLYEIVSLDSKFIVFAILIVCAVIVLDCVMAVASAKNRQAGLTPQSTTAEGGQRAGAKRYISDIQGLAGTPDAVLTENGYFIPIERKPFAKKIHDRYVAQLLVYMRLVEEFEGKKPPYGYLILGPNCRRFKIENSEERQAWLQGIIEEMRGVLEAGKEAKPAPHPRKCQRCQVRDSCDHKVLPAPRKKREDRQDSPSADPTDA